MAVLKCTLTTLVETYLNDPKWKDSPSRNLAEHILNNHPEFREKYGQTGVRDKIYKSKKRIQSAEENDDTIDILLHNDTKWRIIDGNYEWKTAKGHIQLSVDFIDNLFYEYSEHGKNLSQTQIINKYDLKVWQWTSIKNTLQLYKKSHIFSPHTVEHTDPKDLEEMVKEKISKVFSNVGFQVEENYNKKLRQEYKKVIFKQSEHELFFQTILTELHDMFANQPKPQHLPAIRVNAESKVGKIVNVFIFDVHFGAEARTQSLPQYSPSATVQMFDQISQEVNVLEPSEVHIWFGGDNIESFTGLNHPDAWRGLAKGYYGAEVIKRAYKTYVEFISKISNVKKIYAVPGNHDRATESKLVDSHGWMAQILFELIKLSFDQRVEIEYNEKLISASVDGIQYLMSHGDKKLTNINPSELILRYGDPYKFNLLVSGHWHERKIKADHENFRQIVCPSLFIGNDYSVDLGYSSGAGYLVAINNGYNKPKIIDNPL